MSFPLALFYISLSALNMISRNHAGRHMFIYCAVSAVEVDYRYLLPVWQQVF